MEVSWIAQNWFDLLQSVGIVGGLIFTAVSLRTDARVRRVSNLLTITARHRDLWTRLQERPELARVLSRDVDLQRDQISGAEELFVTFVVLHLNSVQEAIRQRMYPA